MRAGDWVDKLLFQSQMSPNWIVSKVDVHKDVRSSRDRERQINNDVSSPGVAAVVCMDSTFPQMGEKSVMSVMSQRALTQVSDNTPGQVFVLTP